MSKLLSGFNSSQGAVAWTDPNHPGYGLYYLILTGNDNGQLTWQDSLQAASHTINVCIPWESLGAFRFYALTSTNSSTVSGVTSVTRTYPMLTPFATQFPNQYAVSLAGKGSGIDNNVSDTRLYSDLIVAVTFQTLTYGVEESQPFIEINYAESADYITVPDANLSFEGNGEIIEHDAGVLVGQVAIQITFHQLPDLGSFLSGLYPYKGKVNSVAVVLDGFSYDAGTLLFPTFGGTKSVSTQGVITADATVQFLQRDLPWNQGIRSDGTADTIIITGTTTSPYATADLNEVLSA